MTDNSSKDLEWNIGSHRIEYIGKKTVQVRENFDKAQKHSTKGRISDYFSTLNTLYFTIRGYIDEEEEKERLDEKMDELDNCENLEDRMDDIKELDKEIQEKRLDLGLDIPSKTSPDSILD